MSSDIDIGIVYCAKNNQNRIHLEYIYTYIKMYNTFT